MKFVSLLFILLSLVLDQTILLPLSSEKIYNINSTWQIPEKSVEIAENIPLTFDARAHWPECPTIGLIRDQGACPDHWWVFGAVDVMSDRLCIASKGSIKVKVSAEDLINCWNEGHYSATGRAPYAYQYWHSNGIVTGGFYGGDGCKPYATPPSGQAARCLSRESCIKKCQPGYPRTYEADKYFGSVPYAINNVSAIQTEILQNGPVTAYFNLCKDFPKPGIYIQTSKEDCTQNVVRIIGWGNEDRVDYWLAANSWGIGAHEKGFFKIRRGTNEAGIDDAVAAARPIGELDSLNENREIRNHDK